jgi:ferredoxin
MHCILVQPSGQSFAAGGDQTILQAALAAGVFLPSSCRNGTCRECGCRVLRGAASHTIPWPGLSADEKAEGWILPCVAQARSDLVLDAPAVHNRPKIRPSDGTCDV